MQVGLISDIHGNLPALEAVLTDMPEVDAVWCLGDLVGYNPWPAECLYLVQESATEVVQGNHDRRLSEPRRMHLSMTPMARKGLELTKEQLSEDEVQWLEDLPEQTLVNDGRILLSHSDPRFRDAYLFPEEFQNLDRFLENEQPDVEVLVMGHTHVPHVEEVDDVLVVNPGSVGQPRDSDPRASYAVLDLEERSVELRRVEYDVEAVIEEVEESDLPEQIGQRLRSGE